MDGVLAFIFSREKYKEIIIDNLKYCIANKGLVLYAYVIMTNHIHMLIRARNGENLAALVRDFKRYTAKVIYRELKADTKESRKNWMLWVMESQGKKSSSNEKMKVWIHENHPVALVTNTMMDQRLAYIHENPVRAGICYTPEDYQYSSAGFYAGEIGVLEVEQLA